jgi:hypothetical protein
MRRLNTLFNDVRLSDQARRLARWQNPVVASPAAPLETVAALFALEPSLMPRTSTPVAYKQMTLPTNSLV